jgi:hypothetical protein
MFGKNRFCDDGAETSGGQLENRRDEMNKENEQIAHKLIAQQTKIS